MFVRWLRSLRLTLFLVLAAIVCGTFGLQSVLLAGHSFEHHSVAWHMGEHRGFHSNRAHDGDRDHCKTLPTLESPGCAICFAQHLPGTVFQVFIGIEAHHLPEETLAAIQCGTRFSDPTFSYLVRGPPVA